jgi:hypothetical protein
VIQTLAAKLAHFPDSAPSEGRVWGGAPPCVGR